MSIHPTKLATAKLSLVRDTALDGALSKLALRLIGIFVGIHMRPEHGGVAWPSTKFMCEQLGVSSESKVRSALYALLERGYLAAERKAGETTRYRIADRYFDGSNQPPIGATPQPLYGAGSEDTQPPIGATPQPQYGAGRAPPIGATNTVNRKPLIEDRKPPLYSPNRSGADSIWPGEEVGVSSFGATPSTFERFEAIWQWGQGESVKQARTAFHRLSESERESAIQGAAIFQSAMAGRQHPPHASTYFDERKWTCQARNASAASQTYARPKATLKNGVALLLTDSYFASRSEPNFAAENTIDLEAVRLDHTDEPITPAVPAHERDRRVVLHPRSQQLEAWHAYERRVHGRAKPGLRRPTEWPPEAQPNIKEAHR
ncbi:hypothetical protein [Methylocystis sp. SB2]|uniref:hypothetical protein n=1 Tax=Methylocystis sp. (strain SB2) TaxID=743836 RepID=UPI0003FBF92D|nr:hypothetical protein [Methylocystis sp. SB2]ULO22975.1 helix-turn-helix domain-containing protein [Methylocystis sp. SB2]